ncbi:hypothetical protein ONZ43_g1428 [Nemania bipapillata]|uniref:Uncharacterized protein n=1 Tax=Nemania bipapillata TaxID=110536 RepID=A0ACC2J4N4_9PEZI|nr:hypothetical protein ONZ43_g1428 [Nemania bipapillata]
MSPLPDSHLQGTLVHRWAPFLLPDSPAIDRILNATQISTRSNVATSNRFGQSNGPEEPLNEWQVAVVVLASVIGLAVVTTLLYCFCRHCKPRPTYYETAAQLGNEQGASPKTAPEPDHRHTPNPLARPGIVLTPPTPVTPSSSIYSEEGQQFYTYYVQPRPYTCSDGMACKPPRYE